MAHTLQQQDSQESSIFHKKPPTKLPTIKVDSKSGTSSRLPKAYSGSKRHSLSSPQGADNSPAIPSAQLNRYQPSKVFLSKCQTELESLLDSIKEIYHQEVKKIYEGELLPDVIVQIGEKFEKPLHKLILASRAFKFYNSLKAFKLIEEPIEQDIIISEFQNKDENIGTEKSEGDIPTSKDLDETGSDNSEKEISIIHCWLPEDLIGPNLLLNFARRLYLDQDVTEDENELNIRFIDWLKLNKPDLIKTPVNHSPNHKESFRTVRPDFDENTPIRSPRMSEDEHLINLSEGTEENVEDLDGSSRATSVQDESLTCTSLTRTETFELITKSNINSPQISTPIKIDPQSYDKSETENADDTSYTELNNPAYAPTTRTGLKPKTFTTPSNMRGNRKPSSSAPGKPSQTISKPHNDSTKTRTPLHCGSLVKQSSSGSENNSASKRSNLSSDTSMNTSAKSTVAKHKTTLNTNKSKPALITRAVPISLERSQSPSTNVIKGSGRNFIATNKRIAPKAIEKKCPIPIDQLTCDSETEVSEVSSFAIEPLSSDNLIAQMDKLSLISSSKLADALSRMFIDELLTDTIIVVKDSKHIRAHMCILAARSAYLAELINKHISTLNSGDIESNRAKRELKVDLSEFSYNAVYFSVLHIYSGNVKIPDNLDMEELTKLAHLLHVVTLRQICIHNLRMNNCHYFHKPCNVCCLGVLKTLPLAWRYDYTELYSKCLQWIGTHFSSIFCLKEFSELKPHDLLEECYSATLSQLTPDNIIPKTIECQKLLKNLPRVKWSESVICLVGRQLEDFCHYVADNYEKILQSESFLNLGNSCWECEILEENLLAAMNHLKPDSGCKTLIQLHRIECSIESYCDEPRNVSDSFACLISKMRKYCERYLLKEAAAVVHCSSWRHMSPSLQKRIKDQAILSTDFDEPTKQLASKPKLPSMSRLSHQQAGMSPHVSEGAKSPRSTPEQRLKSPSSTYLPPPKNKIAAARHVKVLK